jgi:hypothetical protein
MANVVISGDTSGAITLAAPAVAGTNTINLPANTGTVITTASSGGVSQAMLATGVAGTGPAFSAYKSAAQTLSSATFTKITFNLEEYDTNNNFASDRFTPTVAGYYQVNAAVNNGTGVQTVASIYKNGSESKAGTNSSAFTAVASAIIYMNGSTDYIELYGYFAVGTATGSGTNAPFFQACLVRTA